MAPERVAHGSSARGFRAAMIAMIDLLPEWVAVRLRRGGFLSRLVRPLAHRIFPSEASWVSVRSGPGRGLELLIYPQHEKVLWAGTHEPRVQQAIVELLEPGSCFWDIGAHVGFHSLLASRRVGPEGQVHAFEPQPETRDRLKATAARNRCENIKVHDAAISARSGPMLLHSGGAPMLWSLHQEGTTSDSITVECATLAEAAESVEHPRLIKMDVEGAEVEILTSAAPWLREARPYLIVEFHDLDDVPALQQLLVSHRFEQLEAHHWLLRPEN